MFLSGSVTICDSASEMCELRLRHASAGQKAPRCQRSHIMTAEPYGRISPMKVMHYRARCCNNPNLLQYWRRIRRNPIDHERQRVLNGAVNGFQIGWSAQCLRNQDGIIAHLKLRPERVNLRGTQQLMHAIKPALE